MPTYFTEEEIKNIYKNIRLPNEYFTKYSPFPQCPVKAWNYSWQNFDFPRCWAILDFKEWINKYDLMNVDVLGYTDKNDPELEFVDAKEKIFISYPPNDLHTFSTNYKEVFNFFIFNQTIEHLYNPFLAIEEIHKALKPGGYVFTSVPTLNIPHNTPIHYNGYNPMGLAILFLSSDFEILEMGQWGNNEYITRLFRYHDWPGYNSLKDSDSIYNEEVNVCQCWILARKKKAI